MSQPAKLKVLIVDDEKEIGQLIKETIDPLYDGVLACSGKEALSILKKDASSMVCIVSDYNMPDMNGIQLRQSLPERCMEIPFILLSGYITKEDALAGLDAKISAMMPKPFDPAELIELVKKHAQARESTIRERVMLEQIFIEEASSIIDDLEPLIMSLEQRPNDIDTINTIFRLVHTIKGSSGVLESSHVRMYVHKYEDLLSKMKSGSVKVTPDVVSILLQGFDVVRKMINALKIGEEWTQDVEKLAKIFDYSSTISAQELPEPVALGGVAAPAAEVSKESVNVPTIMLDEFMELSGEITVIRNMVNKLVKVIEKESPSNKNVQHLGELLDEMHKINSGIQGRLVETRKVPLSKVFRPLPRTVRDTAKNLGKTIDFKLEGDQIRVDSSLAQVLSDSLIHIVRNSIDHGIETREMRIQRKKKPEGSLTIRAFERGEEVVVSIQDDGGGLDPAKIKKKAVERGLYSARDVDRLSLAKIYSLIFESGFSTASQVTDVSGRGVGMDMVRSSVQKVKGRVEIDSALGSGTTFSLHLPIPKSVLIINSLVVETCGRDFAIPQDSIARLLRLDGKKIRQFIKELQGTAVLDYEGELIPLVDLGAALSLREAHTKRLLGEEILNILIARTDTAYFALCVDRVLDSEEIVVKVVGKHMERLKVYAGATFMGDGSVGLVLNVDGIAEVSGVTSIRQAAADQLAQDQATETPSNLKDVLLFDLWCNGAFAIPLTAVHRLEDIQKSSLQTVGDRSVVIYRDQVMPIVDLTDALGVKVKGADERSGQVAMPVVVSKINERYVGFAVRSIGDVASMPTGIDTLVRDRNLIEGSFEVNGRVVALVDVFATLDAQGILKTIDPAINLKNLSYGVQNDPATSTHKAVAGDLADIEKKPEEPTAFAGDGWGLF